LKRFKFLIASVLGGILLWATWPPSVFTFLIFIAWIPLLWVEDRVESWGKLFGLTYLHMLLWNILTTWWIWNASAVGALSAILANSLIMCLPWLLMFFTKRKFGRWIGYSSLIIFWITFEYIHHNWELSWPWLTLGNAFATHPDWVQWYEYTGTTGGSLWILLVNILLYHLIKKRNIPSAAEGLPQAQQYSTINVQLSIITLLILLMPLGISFLVKPSIPSPQDPGVNQQQVTSNIVIVQPNINPYIKFQTGEEESQLQKLISLSESMIDSNTILVIWPETAIPVQSDEDQLKENFFLNPVWAFLKRHPRINLLSGLEGFRVFNKRNSIYSKEFPSQPGLFFEAYNSAVIFDSSSYNIYHKSKLVPGVETLPTFLYFMSSLFDKFGGTTGGYAKDKERKVLQASNSYLKIAPAICYESIYGDFTTGFIRKGANIICVITNDGWWGKTSGHRQHLNYARLRAVETRRWIARSANTGISCFIDPEGNIINPQPWDTASAIKMNVPVSDEQTYFVRNGDVLSRVFSVVSILLLLLNIFYWIKKRISHKK